MKSPQRGSLWFNLLAFASLKTLSSIDWVEGPLVPAFVENGVPLDAGAAGATGDTGTTVFCALCNAMASLRFFASKATAFISPVCAYIAPASCWVKGCSGTADATGNGGYGCIYLC